jgi:hypothetical protein
MSTDQGLLSRIRSANFLGYSHNKERNLYQTFGYDRDLRVEDLEAMYYRNDIANRIISAFPQATWRNEAIISDEDGDSEETSDFTKDVNDFISDNKIYHYLERLDRMSGLGSYAILFMAFDDEGKTNEPLEDGDHELLFVQPYKEISAKITKYVDDVNDPRYGLPEIYTINPRSDNNKKTSNLSAFNVHHSRVIHVSEFLDEDDVFGVPRLMPVYNRLKDLEKVVGGSSEMFWQNGRGGFVFSADKEAKFSDEDKTKMKESAEKYTHELERFMIGKGITVSPISLAVPDPKPNVDVLLDLISGTVGIPKRILTGSERGELSSSQDENNFASRIDERRRVFAAPMILEAFIQKMIDTGNLIEPNGIFKACWENDAGLNEEQKADIATKKTQAIATYSNSMSQDVMPIGEFREKILGLDAEIDYEAYPVIVEEDEELDFEEPENDNEKKTVEIEDDDANNGSGSEDQEIEDEDENEEDLKSNEDELFKNFRELPFMSPNNVNMQMPHTNQ